MTGHDKVNILLVDDHPAKLLSYEVILRGLGENLLMAVSGREALEHLLKTEIAVVLVDVCMPDLDGFQLASMIREHPRFQKTAMIFISAIHLTEVDRLRGYEMGAVDYVPVPVVPEVLRAKVRVFSELYRKTRQLERLNSELEGRVAARTAELEASTARLLESEQRRSLALAAGQMGSWDWDRISGDCLWDRGQYRIFDVDPETFAVTPENVRTLIHPEDRERLHLAWERIIRDGQPYQAEFRVRRHNGEERWCTVSAATTLDSSNRIVRISGVTVDITDRKEAEEHQAMLAREVDHRAKNALALVQSIVRLTRANSIDTYIAAIEGRIKALSRAHTVLSHSGWQGADLGSLVDEEFAPYRSNEAERVLTHGPKVSLDPAAAQSLALALHELATNAVKYGALSSMFGRVELTWEFDPDNLVLHWAEIGGPRVQQPSVRGFGTKIIVGSMERQLAGQVSFSWEPEGLRCTLSVPRSDKIKPLEHAGSDAQNVHKDGDGRDLGIIVRGRRVMIVEDETLVAMMLGDQLADLGLCVVGPFSRVSDATRALMEVEIDAAILDVNLAGELVYPVADVLIARGIPFIFVTGYALESIDCRFSNVHTLQKPIEREVLQRIFVTPEEISSHHSARRDSDSGMSSASATTA